MPHSQPGEQSLSPHPWKQEPCGVRGGGWVCRSHCGPPSALPPLQPSAAAWRAQHWSILWQLHPGWCARAMVPEKGLRDVNLCQEERASCLRLLGGVGSERMEEAESVRAPSGEMEEYGSMNLCYTGTRLPELFMSPTATKSHSKIKNSMLYWCLLSFPQQLWVSCPIRLLPSVEHLLCRRNLLH